MGRSIYFTGAPDGGDGPFDLCCIGGWTQFIAWAESLTPASSFAAIRELTDAGAVTGTDALSEQLTTALHDHPPPEAVAATAEGLLELVGVGDPDETAVVTDGEGPDDGCD